MGLFWSYFRDTLSWPWLATPGALCVIAKGLADTMDAVRDDIRWVRDQWVVPLAEQDRMQGYGASRGAPRTRHDDDARHRRRIERALAWHRIGGTVTGLSQILAEYGYPGCLVESLRDDNPARWASFRVVAPMTQQGAGFAERDSALLDWVIAEYKPARSRLDRVSLHANLSGLQRVASGCGAGEVATVWPRCPDGLQVCVGISIVGRLLGTETLTVWPLAITHATSQGRGVSALCAAQSFDTVTVYPEA